MHATTTLTRAPARGGWSGLLGLILGLTVAAWALLQLGGAPQLPNGLPEWDKLARILQGAYLPLDMLGQALTTAAWHLGYLREARASR